VRAVRAHAPPPAYIHTSTGAAGACMPCAQSTALCFTLWFGRFSLRTTSLYLYCMHGYVWIYTYICVCIHT
jgi:hypothetical protein